MQPVKAKDSADTIPKKGILLVCAARELSVILPLICAWSALFFANGPST